MAEQVLRLADLQALVTGAARGIGAGISERLVAEGATVILVDVDDEAVAGTADSLRDKGRPGVVEHAVADVTSVEDVRAVAEDYGNVDVLVNNAGAWTFKPFLESEPQDWRRDIDVNLFGVLNVTRAVLPGMMEREFGRVINIVSDSARVGELNVAAYSAAKAGVMGFTRSLAKEVGRRGVTVNAVSLSTTVTESAKETYSAEQLEKMARRYPMGRLGRPQDAASAVAFFALPESSWVTGQTLSVNGGYAML